MVFAKEVLYSPKTAIIYLKYVCPKRTGETGCGAVKKVHFERDPDVKFRRTTGTNFLIT